MRVNIASLYSGWGWMQVRKFQRAVVGALLSVAVLSSQTPHVDALALIADTANLPPIVQTILYSITAAELKGQLSFLASDVLQGRYTPSFGLEVAAEFIAAQFRAAGVDPGGDQEYFQTAVMVDRHMPKPPGQLIVNDGANQTTITQQDITVYDVSQPVRIDHAPVVIFPSKDPDAVKSMDLTGKVVLASAFPISKIRESAPIASRRSHAFDKAVSSSNAALEIIVGGSQKSALNNSKLLPATEAQEHHVPVLAVTSDYLQKWIDEIGSVDAPNRTISLDLAGPDDHKVTLKNVVGILRGSDPALKDTCVLLTAHYDHLGTVETSGRATANRSNNPNDRIYNGANDDGSGTVSVLEIAKALAKVNPHPKRSIVFVLFFGEERGELGSQYYAKHPVFPLAKTIADINLEQVGRTDANNGRQLNAASLTGYDYSEVPKFFEDAGRATGVKVDADTDKDPSDVYFSRSDNFSLAEEGVPAHSLSVAFDYPDYHGLADKWQKIDYENMARVDRMVALGVLNIANSPRTPQWNAQNPHTLPYREAQQRQHSRAG